MTRRITQVFMLLLLVILLAVGIIKFASIPSLPPKTNWAELLQVEESQVDDVFTWAFGPNWPAMEQRYFDDAWRDRHSDLFIILGSDPIDESMLKIGTAWKERKKDGST